jgi:hypothetical protein
MAARVRHHTDDRGLDGIRADGAINPSRGWGDVPSGVHVELEPFGTTRPYRKGQPSPKGDLGLVQDGAYVEFDLPAHCQVRIYSCGARNTGLIPTDKPLTLHDLKPIFVKVRRMWWEFWRTKPE